MSALIKSKPWKLDTPSAKILVMRFQALGDVVITLPYLLSLRRQNPSLQLHFLSREEVCEIPGALDLFGELIVIRGGRNSKLQFLHVLGLVPRLLGNRYDVVIDLQNHWISRLIRKILNTRAWSEFDRTSNRSAGERTRLTIQAAGFPNINIQPGFQFQPDVALAAIGLLKEHGWDGVSQLVGLNPAGNFSSRNWPLENYLMWARLWKAAYPQSQFVLMLTQQHQTKAIRLRDILGDACIDLSTKTTQVQAFAIVSNLNLMLSEDSGLMHMAWVQGVPTLALFGSTRSDWAAPQGAWSAHLDSSDLECGPCMLPVCKYGDNRCLTRYTPQLVFERTRALFEQSKA